MSRHSKSACPSASRAAAALLFAVLLVVPDWVHAGMSTGSSRSSGSSGGGLGSSSSRNGSSSRSSRSSRSSGSEDDFGGDEDSRDSGSRRSSSNRRGSSSSRSSSSRGSGARSFSTGSKSSSKPEAPPFVFGTKFERDGVRPHGTVLSSTAFSDLPGRTESVSIGGTEYYRRNDSWYQRIEQNGWTCYAEIYPPAGARVSSVPDGAVKLSGGDRTYYATKDAVYAYDPGAGYVVVEPPVGASFDRLPEAAKKGIPVVVNGTSYYRYLGLFYREDKDGSGERYVVTKSPFLADTANAASPAQEARNQTPFPGPSLEAPPYDAGAVTTTGPPVPGSPRATFLLPIENPANVPVR